jgi:hypothetical protein
VVGSDFGGEVKLEVEVSGTRAQGCRGKVPESGGADWSARCGRGDLEIYQFVLYM